MNDDREKISKFAVALQTQNNLPLWSLANEQVIYSIAIGEKPIWGKKTKIVNWLADLSWRIQAADFLIFFVGLIQLFAIWFKLPFKQTKPKTYDEIFACFGAAAEDHMYAEYLQTHSTAKILRVNTTSYANILNLGKLRFKIALKILWQNSFGYSKKLHAAESKIRENAADFLTVCALGIGVYSFYLAYWQLAKLKNIKKIVFLTPDMAAFAGVDSGIKTEYLQHGLMSLSLLFPSFNVFEVLTNDEQRYLYTFLPTIKINKKNNLILKNLKNNVLVLSPNVFLNERIAKLEMLSTWAKQNNLQIILRPTPAVSQSDLDRLKMAFPTAVFDDLTVKLEESIKYWSPKIVASWLSTGLALALEYGSLPVTLCEESINKKWWNMVYPLKQRVLFWTRDYDVITDSIASNDVYLAQVAQLRHYSENI